MIRRSVLALGLLLTLLVSVAIPASSGVYLATFPVLASAPVSPFAGCTADAGSVGTNYPNTEVEPWLDVNPTNPKNLVAAWQQDRWNNGGSRGLVAGVSKNGGKTWKQVVIPKLSACSGSDTYIRASDPWLSFAPNGDLYHISLSTTGGITFEAGFPDTGMLVSKSTDGGLSWSDPIPLIQDQGPNVLNDKQSITADPHDANFVYAVWDRIANASERAEPVEVFQHAIGFRAPTWFARTTNGGASWETARMIYDPGEINQTIGNQIVVLPNGDLLDFFDLIYNFKNAQGVRGFNVAYIRSSDQGATWTPQARIVDTLLRVTVRDPDTGATIRTADFNPDVAVDPASGALYLAWQDGRFSGLTRSDVAFTMSTDGGQTWTPTVRLSVNSNNRSAFLPSVHVAGDGTVGVSFYDFRNHITGGSMLKTDHWLIHCHPSLTDCTNAANWSETHVDGPFDYRNFPVASGLFAGDYLGLAFIGNTFATLFIRSGATANTADAFFATVGP
ncbi:MAG TPA: sialidase family protein [Methylomirabilota bacterium]|jgi:hypothetical protein|nr:sialidase family protein [Methylomirabilota bacterium]